LERTRSAATRARIRLMTDSTPRLPRPRSRRRWQIALGLLVLAALAGSALAPSGLFSSSASKPFSVRRVAGAVDSSNHLARKLTKVYGTSLSAKAYGTAVGQSEDQGVNTKGQLISDLAPLPPATFRGPVRAYKRYAGRWLQRVAVDVRGLDAALAAGNRPVAEAAWRTTWSGYLHLGAVYGLFGALDQRIDGMPGGLPGGTRSPRFTGLHRIEMGLWSGAAPRSLAPWGRLLAADVGRLERRLPHVAIDPLDYATRAHEILEDAQRDLLSGMDVPWSGEGVLGTAAGLDATDEVMHTLSRLLGGRDNTQVEAENELVLLHRALASVRRAHGGTWPTLSELSEVQREQLNGTLAGTLGALALVPGTLETKPVTAIPSLPGGAP
jgi:iron uptake system EfeUOB component EfeO/EfeM